MARTAVTNRTEIQNYPYSINFVDSGNQRITCPGSASYTTNIVSNYTILSLVKLNAKTLNTGISHSIISNNAASASNNLWYYVEEPSRKVVSIITNGVSTQSFTSTNTVSTNWAWVGTAYQAGTALKIIINTNVETIAPTLTAVQDNTRVLSVGSTNSLTRIHGNIARIVYFSGQLTSTELSRFVYGGQMPSVTAVLDWRMTEGSGTTIADSSGNGNVGTLSSSTWSTSVPLKIRTIETNRVIATNRITV